VIFGALIECRDMGFYDADNRARGTVTVRLRSALATKLKAYKPAVKPYSRE
jgi:hypothetical protein